MSISTVLTLGYGFFGMVNFLPTLGYTPGISSIDTHDGFVDIEDDTPKKLEETRLRKEELREQISRNFEALTGEEEVPTISEVSDFRPKTGGEVRILKTLKTDLQELEDINKQLVMMAKRLQEQEMNDIAFIVSQL